MGSSGKPPRPQRVNGSADRAKAVGRLYQLAAAAVNDRDSEDGDG